MVKSCNNEILKNVCNCDTLVTDGEAYLHIQRSLLLCKDRHIFDNALSYFGLNKLLKRMLLFIQFRTKLELCVLYDFIIFSMFINHMTLLSTI